MSNHFNAKAELCKHPYYLGHYHFDDKNAHAALISLIVERVEEQEETITRKDAQSYLSAIACAVYDEYTVVDWARHEVLDGLRCTVKGLKDSYFYQFVDANTTEYIKKEVKDGNLIPVHFDNEQECIFVVTDALDAAVFAYINSTRIA